MKTKTKTKPAANGQKLLPQDRVAEKALLGSLMIDPAAIFEVAAMIQPDAFYSATNGLVYQTMLDLSAKGEPLDPIGIMAELRRHGHADIGDGQKEADSYLIGLLNEPTSSLHATSYARVVADMATRRKMIAVAQNIATQAWDESEPLDEIADSAQGLLFEAIQQRTRRGLNHISLGMADYLTNLEERLENPVDVSGLPTGYIDLDKIINGLIPQRLYIIAGRPSMGKTALMLGMIDYMSVGHGKRCAVFSLEMSKDELTNRMLARRTNVDTQRLERGDLNGEEVERVYAESGRISQAPIFISDTPAQSPNLIRAECLRKDAELGLDVVFIDYLQLMKVPGERIRLEEVSTIARAAKNLSKELNVPVVLLSQLNRSTEKRTDHRPSLADLRGSGEIEEAADVVMFLYRDEYYNPDDSLRPNIGEVAIAKARGGPTGVIDLFWQAYTASYRNLERIEVRL